MGNIHNNSNDNKPSRSCYILTHHLKVYHSLTQIFEHPNPFVFFLQNNFFFLHTCDKSHLHIDITFAMLHGYLKIVISTLVSPKSSSKTASLWSHALIHPSIITTPASSISWQSFPRQNFLLIDRIVKHVLSSCATSYFVSPRLDCPLP